MASPSSRTPSTPRPWMKTAILIVLLVAMVGSGCQGRGPREGAADDPAAGEVGGAGSPADPQAGDTTEDPAENNAGEDP
ncbi:MAG: hypothetical protein ACO35Q_14895, partial [Prochlorothrix sp.]